jgi:hypothetical protein
MVMLLLAKVSPLHLGIADDVVGASVGDLAAGHEHDEPLRKTHDRAHDVLDQNDGDAALVEADQEGENVRDLDVRQAGHRLVGDEQLRLRRHGAGELELAHVDLRQVAGIFRRAVGEADETEKLAATVSDFTRRETRTLPGVDRIEQRHPHVVGDRHAKERPWKLETARQPQPGPRVRGQPFEAAALETHAAGLVDQRAGEAIDERALARAVRPDQADALARRDRQVDSVECDETAEPFAESFNFKKLRGHEGFFSEGFLSRT